MVEVTEILPRTANYNAVAGFNGDGSADVAAVIVDCCQPTVLEAWLSSRKFSLTTDLIPAMPAGPYFLRGDVLNSASFSASALAPGELVTISGRDFGPDTLVAASSAEGVFPTELEGIRVLFNNLVAPILSASSGEVSTIVPFNLDPKTRADVTVEYLGVKSPPVSIFVDRAAPGLLTVDGAGPAPGRVAGVTQVTMRLPDQAPKGNIPLGISVDGIWSQLNVTVSIR